LSGFGYQKIPMLEANFEINKPQYKIDITEKANSHFMEIDILLYKN